MTKEKTKEELLKHYEQRKPRPFIQFDGFDPLEDAPSDAGPRIVRTETWELMHGADVRILINPRIDRDKVLEILDHLIARVRRDEDQLVWGMHHDDQIREKTKEELLQDYAQREPKPYIQLDGFDAPGDCMSDPDTGLGCFRGDTWELMHGADVRTLINPGTDREKVLEILEELVAWMRRDEDQLVWGMHYDDQIMLFEFGGLATYRGKSYLINSKADLEALKRLREEDLDCPF
jgi:hypothetical protein